MKRLLGLILLPALCGCGTSHTSAPPSYHYDLRKAAAPSCAHAGKPIPLPAAFPKQFPFPSGTVIDRTARLHAAKGQIGIYRYVQSTSFKSTVNFFKSHVVAKGFKLVYFEVDSPHDSEGTYKGFGKLGVWQLAAIAACPKAMVFSASAEPAK